MKSKQGRHFFVLADTEASGEWIATRSLFKTLKEQKLVNADLVAFDSSHQHKNLSGVFKRITLVPHLNPRSPFRLLKYLASNLKNIRKAIPNKELTEGYYDGIIITHYLLYYGYLLSKKFHHKTKIIFVFHGIRNFDPPKPWDIYGWVLCFLERLAWVLADVVIVPAQENKTIVYQKLGFWGRNKDIFVLPNIVPTQFFYFLSKEKIMAWRRKHGIPADVSVILFSGRIAVTKGIFELVKAFSAYHRLNPQSFLILAYPKSQLNQNLLAALRHEAARAKVNDFVLFLPEVAREEQPWLYQAADCTILPSLFEMSSLTMWESLASGTPFIGTATGDAGTVISQIDVRLILPDNRPGEIVKALNYFFRLSAQDRARMGLQAYRLAQSHKSEIVAKQFMKLVNRLTAA